MATRGRYVFEHESTLANAQALFDRLAVARTDPAILAGKPAIKGTRISVELVLGWRASDWSFDQILESYPHTTREAILAAPAFAADMMREDEHIAIHKATA